MSFKGIQATGPGAVIASGLLTNNTVSVLFLDPVTRVCTDVVESNQYQELTSGVEFDTQGDLVIIVSMRSSLPESDLKAVNAYWSDRNLVLDTMLVGSNSWYSLLCSDSSCCPKDLPEALHSYKKESLDKITRLADAVANQVDILGDPAKDWTAEVAVELVKVLQKGEVPEISFYEQVVEEIYTRDTLLSTAAHDESGIMWKTLSITPAESPNGYAVRAVARLLSGDPSRAAADVLCAQILDPDHNLTILVSRAITTDFPTSMVREALKVVKPITV